MSAPIDQRRAGWADRAGSYMDRTVSAFFPSWGARRALARRALGMMQPQATAHRGASTDRLYSHFVTSQGSADADNLYELPTLRGRCRDLIRNDGYARSALMTLISHVVGTGFSPLPTFDREDANLDEDAADKLRKKMERIWEIWGEHADITGRLDIDGLTRLHARCKFVDGDGMSLIRMKERQRVRYRLCLQSIESDRLGDSAIPSLTAKVRSGIEIGQDGEPVAYYIRKTHPGDVYLSGYSGDPTAYERIPAFSSLGWPNVLHYYSVDRPGQTRGVPIFGPVIALFKDLMDYREAEIVAAKAAACYMMVIKKQDPMASASGDATLPGADSATTNNDGQRLMGFEPGMVAYLGLNEEMQGFQPNRPSSTFDPFIRSCLRIIAAATGQTYEQVSHDLSQVNYSSIRAGNLEARRFYSMEQSELMRNFPAPLWRCLMEEAFLIGDLDIADFMIRRDEWVRSKWDVKLGEEWVDPLKEILAIEKAIELNLTTKAAEIAARGGDWKPTFEQRARETRMEETLQIVPKDKSTAAADAQDKEDQKPEDPKK